MKLTKIHVSNDFGTHAPMHKHASRISSDVLILVPDEESYHIMKGLALIYNKVWEVHLLEPGTPMSWQGMYSPWHLNTDSYRLQFIDHTPVYVGRV